MRTIINIIVGFVFVFSALLAIKIAISNHYHKLMKGGKIWKKK